MDTSDRKMNRRQLVGAGSALGALALLKPGYTYASTSTGGMIERKTAQGANLPTPREQTVVIEQSPNNVWDSFNPFIPNGESYNYGLAIVCREYFFYQNILTGEMINRLGEKWTYNDDFSALTLTIRDGVTWSDGKPFTAEDIVFSQELLRKNEGLNGSGDYVEDVKSCEVVDKLNVKWTLNKPDVRFHYRFISTVISDGVRVMPKHIWEKEDPGKFKFNPPVQTGPYVLKESSASKLYYLWEKNPDYWNKAEFDPAPQYVLYRQGGGVDTAVATFLSNGLDISGEIDYLNQQVIQSQTDKTARFDFPDPNPRGFWFNQEGSTDLFKTADGRWAFSYLIDRETIANTIWQPPSRPATYPWADYDGWKPWAPDSVMSKFDLTYNPDKANEMLDKLGADQRDDDDVRILNGKPLKLTMITPSPTTGLEYQIGTFVAQGAKDAGLDIEVKSLPGSAFGDTYFTGRFDISSHWCGGFNQDPLGVYAQFQSKYYKPVGERTVGGDGVACRMQDKKLDDYVAKLEAADPEDETNKPLFDEALEYFMSQLPNVASIQTLYTGFFNTTTWSGWPTNDDQYAIPLNWWGAFVFAIGGVKPAGS